MEVVAAMPVTMCKLVSESSGPGVKLLNVNTHYMIIAWLKQDNVSLAA